VQFGQEQNAAAPLPREKSMLRISRADYDLIRWEAERSYPHECCGILLGTVHEGQRVVTLTLTCENTRQDSPVNRYEIDPQRIIVAMKLARRRGESLLGFYHSHPEASSRFSSTDLAEAHWFGCSYVITAVERGRAATTDSFVLLGNEDEKEFQKEEIEIIANARPLQVAL
jgi:proteasome lid subunit RPN8/RPN11